MLWFIAYLLVGLFIDILITVFTRIVKGEFEVSILGTGIIILFWPNIILYSLYITVKESYYD